MATETGGQHNRRGYCAQHGWQGAQTEFTVCVQCSGLICVPCMIRDAKRCRQCERPLCGGHISRVCTECEPDERLSLLRVAGVFGVTLAGGAAGGAAYTLLPPFLVGVLVWVSIGALLIYGLLVSRLATWVAGVHSGLSISVTAGLGMVAGFAGVRVLLDADLLTWDTVVIYLVSGGVTAIGAGQD